MIDTPVSRPVWQLRSLINAAELEKIIAEGIEALRERGDSRVTGRANGHGSSGAVDGGGDRENAAKVPSRPCGSLSRSTLGRSGKT